MLNSDLKRILLVTGQLRYSGAERVLLSLANDFVRRGIEVYIIPLSAGEGCAYDDVINSKIHILPIKSSKLRIFRRLSGIIFIRKSALKIKADVVVAFNTDFGIAAILALLGTSFPVIVSERNDPKIEPKNKIIKILRKLLYPLSDGFVFQTEEARDFFSAKIRSRSEVIPNPVAARNIPVKYNGIRNKEIVSIGRLDQEQKNFSLLISAFSIVTKKFHEFSLIIYGDGPDKELFEKEINRLGLKEKIKLPGSSTKVHEDIVDKALFVLPSNFEGMPNALIEAMAIGMPVISTDCPCGGPRFLIKNNENGLLVPINDVEKMVKAMEYILNNPEIAEKMANKAYEIRDILSLDKISDKWMEYLRNLKKS